MLPVTVALESYAAYAHPNLHAAAIAAVVGLLDADTALPLAVLLQLLQTFAGCRARLGCAPPVAHGESPAAPPESAP